MESGCFYYWMCQLDLSVISFRMCRACIFFSTIVFGLVVTDFTGDNTLFDAYSLVLSA